MQLLKLLSPCRTVQAGIGGNEAFPAGLPESRKEKVSPILVHAEHHGRPLAVVNLDRVQVCPKNNLNHLPRRDLGQRAKRLPKIAQTHLAGRDMSKS